MQLIKTVALAAFMALAVTPAPAQDSNYTPGSVWVTTRIKVEPGQFENYMDYLAKEWKRNQEYMKKEGYVLAYHVLSVNNARMGEPDIILAVEYKDYIKTAESEALQKKVEAMMARDTRKLENEFGERKVMRTMMGSMELQELKLK